MEIRKVPISEINPAPYNPRVDLQPGDSEYEQLRCSIATFGYIEPLVWNQRTRTLVSGHQRFKILLAQGTTEIDVSVVDLPIEKEKQLNLILNRLRGKWHDNKLAYLLEDLKTNFGVDLASMGFTSIEVNRLFDLQADDREDDFDITGALDSQEEPIAKLGDIFQLGEHRVMCADATILGNVEMLMAGQQAGIVVTDPPYLARYAAEQRPTNIRKKAKWAPILNDDLPEAEYAVLLERAFENMRRFMAPGAALYCWNGFAQFGRMYDLLIKLNFHVGGVIVWEKPCPSPSYADYSWQSEFCCYAWLKGNGAHRWYGPHTESNVWKCGRDSAVSLKHPSQKPVELPERALRNSSQRGDIVLDMFLGSGSTLVAAERLGRKCFGLELEPRYVDAIVRRYIAFVGKDKVSSEIRERYVKEEKNGK